MEPNSREFYKQCAFQKFCNTVLHNEACDTHRELRRHKAKEVTFSDMTLDEARQLHTFDEYFLENIEDDEEYEAVADAFDEMLDAAEYDELVGEEEAE